MKIGLIDVDGHAKKKKWGATIYPTLAHRKDIRIYLNDAKVVKHIKTR